MNRIFLPNKWLLLLIVLCVQLQAKSGAPLSGSGLSDEAVLQSDRPDSMKVRMLHEMAWNQRFQHPDLSRKIAAEVIELSRKINNTAGIANAYRCMATSFAGQAKPLDAIPLFDSAFLYARRAGNTETEASCYNSEAGMFGDFGDFDKAIELYTSGLQVAIQSHNKKLQAVFYNNLADAYQNTKRNTELVRNYFAKSRDLALELNDYPGAALSSANLAREFSIHAEKDNAENELLHTVNFLQHIAYGSYLHATTCDVIAAVWLDLKEFERAETFATLSYRQLDSLKMGINSLKPLLVLARVELLRNQIENARGHANTIIHIATEKHAKQYLMEGYHLLFEIEQNQHHFEQALNYFQLYKKWNDSFFQAERERNISLIELKSELARRQLEVKEGLDLKVQENNLLTQSNRTLKTTVILVAILVILLLVLGLILYSLNRKKRILNNALLQKNEIVQRQTEEKDLLIHEIHHRVKNNLAMLQGLFHLQSKTVEDPGVKKALEDSQARLLSMALVHRHLYENDRDGVLELTSFIRDLLLDVSDTISNNGIHEVQFDVKGDPVVLDIRHAIPAGLILNELITNSLKYAFPEHSAHNQISVWVQHISGSVVVWYRDNGVGFPPDFDMQHAGFGFKIIQLFCKQIKASIELIREPDASAFVLRIPIAALQKK